MPLPNQANRDLMTNHEGYAIKGYFKSGALDKAAPVDLSNLHADIDAVLNGSVVSLNQNGHFQLGLEENAMPIFILQHSYDHDVVGPDGNIIGAYNSGSVNESTGQFEVVDSYTAANRAPTQGVMNGLVATGGYEMRSTEFVTTETYTPNMALTAGAPGDADAGLLKPGVYCDDTICGVVSAVIPAGGITNEHQREVIQFWTVFVPVCPGTGTGTGTA